MRRRAVDLQGSDRVTGDGGKKHEPPLKLDMSFEEALSRYVATSPTEVQESIERARKRKPPEEVPRRPVQAKSRKLPGK